MRSGGPHRRGFSLLEMLVSLAVLVVALLVVSNIFALTAQTARSAVAISDVQRRVRDFLYTLEQDLNGINPAESILILSGATQAAARSEEKRDAEQFERFLVGDPADVPRGFDPVFSTSVDPSTDQYSDPRTDILAFLTNRALQSKSPAINDVSGSGPEQRFQQAIQNGARSAPNLVVYGHAAIDVPDGITWPATGNEIHPINPPGGRDQLSDLPLTQWHLARRATLIRNRSVTTLNVAGIAPTFPAGSGPLEFRRAEPTALTAGDTASWSLDGLLDVYIAGGNEAGPPAFPAPTASPYLFPSGTGWSPVRENLVWQMLYQASGQNNNRHVATVFNSPPPAMSGNLAVHGLPGCVWFQVEFLLPEDPRNAADHPVAAWRDDQPRWVEVRPDDTYVFVPDTAENRAAIIAQSTTVAGLNGLVPIGGQRLSTFGQVVPPGGAGYADIAENRNVRTWPYAIRITVRVLDPDGVLATPVERSLVHRFD